MRLWPFNRRGEDEFERELEAHIDLEADRLMAEGLTASEAQAAARRRFGNVTVAREKFYRSRHIAWLDDLAKDLAYASRTMLQTRGFVVAVASLALTAGATSAVYGTSSWLLRRSSEAVRESDRIVQLRVFDRAQPDFGPFGMAWQQYLALRSVQDGFVDIAAYAKLAGILSTEASDDQVTLEFVTGNYFDLLGVRPLLGRAFLSDDDQAGALPVGMLSARCWQTRFAGDASVLERTIEINGVVVRVVGVVPREFDGFEVPWVGSTCVWMPMHAGPTVGYQFLGPRMTSFFPVIGRMRPEVSESTVQERAETWLKNLPLLSMPTWTANAVSVTPSRHMRLGPSGGALVAPTMNAVLLVTFLVQIAASLNLANFLFGRAVDRRRELAVRAAIGAARGRLVRQLLTEVVLLAMVAAVFTVATTAALAYLMAPLSSVYLDLPGGISNFNTTEAVDLRMLGGALALTVLSTLAFGLAPVMMASFQNPMDAIKTPKPSWTWSRWRLTNRQALLVFQVAMSIALAITASLFLRSFVRAAAVASGYGDPNSVLVARIVATSLTSDQRPAFYAQLLERLNSMPQVSSAAIGWNPPFAIGVSPFSVLGRDEAAITVRSTAASARFFQTHAVPLVQGEEFRGSPADLQDGVVINTVLADRLWPTGGAIGQLVRHGAAERRVIAVVTEDRCGGLLEDPQPCAWQSFPGNSSSGYIRVRTSDPMSFVPFLRSVVRELAPNVAVAQPSTLENLIRAPIRSYELAATVAAALALFGILLVTTGFTTVFLAMVKGSAREMAIRSALGATPARLTRRVVWQAAALMVPGLVFGIVAARAVAPYVAGRLYQTHQTDPASFLSLPVLIVALGLACVGYTASRAIRVQPATHLHSE